jgi:hypothetical protein
MVNIKVPLNPVQSKKPSEWPPLKPAREYAVLDSDDWWKIAAREHMDVWDLIKFNFQTHVPEEVNWYLRELVGCRHSKDGRNYAFFGADPKKRKIYLPIAPPPPEPIHIPWPDKLKKLQYEVETSSDPQKARFLCMLKTMENRKDDRVIFWSDIAPDDNWVAPFFVERKFGKSLIDGKWLFEHIKSVKDVDMLPYGNGLPRSDTFVTAFHKFLFETPLSPSLRLLREANADINKTHEMLDRWSSVSQGGSSSMPVAYRAIQTFVSKEEDTPGSLLNCLVTTK